MPQLFTVRWPLFARLEAAALFPVAVRLAGETEQVRSFVERQMLPPVSSSAIMLGLPAHMVFWAAVAIAGIVPYFVLLLVTDRFLTVRKGFALLSVVAISVWTVAAFRLSGQWAKFLPAPLLGVTHGLASNQEIALGVGGLALLLHLGALWTGIRDHGDVAERLIAWETNPYRRGNRTAIPRDLYFRQTAGFRGWHQQRQLDGLGGVPKEHPVVKFLYAITWIGVVVGISTAYLAWNGIGGFGRGVAKFEPASDRDTSRLKAKASANAGVAVPTPGAPTAPGTPSDDVHVVGNAPPPLVQRPTEVSASVQASGAIGGPNEAVAERESDGSFAFDAVVNGTHVRMLFDTGASVVGLRAEDAARLGFQIARLTYSSKIKTANGTADVAPIMIDTMMIGNITLRNVPGFVAKQGMLQQNLLGQTFLARLSGFNVEKNLLVLKGH